mmetsp:Transcript_46959/g.73492  ORF Transcript_46959/g.73492 Transcript_46959/m.73492 type:complete len:151 (-) Transcript_46959:396-848(-)
MLDQDQTMAPDQMYENQPRRASFKGSKTLPTPCPVGEITDGLKQVQFEEEAVVETARHRFARSPEPSADEEVLNDLADESVLLELEGHAFQRILPAHNDERQGMKLVTFDATVEDQNPKFHTRLRSPERSPKAHEGDKEMGCSDEEMPQA